MVRQLSYRNTITIPSKILKQICSKPGDLFEITNDGNRIILIPKLIEDKFTELEWKKLERIVKEKGTIYEKAEEAKNHIRDLIDEI